MLLFNQDNTNLDNTTPVEGNSATIKIQIVFSVCSH